MCRKRQVVAYILGILWIGAVFGTGLGCGFVYKIYQSLPSLDYYRRYYPYQTSLFFDRHRNIIGCVAEEHRIVLPKETVRALPITKLIVTTEDRRFHASYRKLLPIDPYAIARALLKNYMAGKIVEGGSTIEQQTVKQLLDPRERLRRSITRKIKEVLLSFQLISEFDKETIMWLYVNEIYFGSGQYGVEAAALWNFNKHANELTIGESAMLAGFIRAPEKFSRQEYFRAAKQRRDMILTLARSEGVVSQKEYEAAVEEKIILSSEFRERCGKEPYVVDYIKSYILPEHGLIFDEQKLGAAWRGIRVHATVDPTMQNAARNSLKRAITDYQARRGQSATIVNGAFIVLENKTGAIRALIGGTDYTKSHYNNATQALRQPGSAFKPFDYIPIIEQKLTEGYSPEEILQLPIYNTRFCCRGKTKRQKWCPKNYDELKMGAASYSMLEAIAKSVNRPALHAAMNPNRRCTLNPAVVVTARRLGITSKNLYETGSRGQLYFRLPIALGAANVTLLELTRAYMVFANRGMFISEYIVEGIEIFGLQITYSVAPPEQRLSSKVADIVNTALREVVLRGTARSLGTLPVLVAGKTGTTDNFSDAWWVGYTPELTAGIWIGGKDKTVSLGYRETGGRVAVPAFGYFIK